MRFDQELRTRSEIGFHLLLIANSLPTTAFKAHIALQISKAVSYNGMKEFISLTNWPSLFNGTRCTKGNKIDSNKAILHALQQDANDSLREFT
jgi:hypothetical protein